MRNIKPINVIFQEGVTQLQSSAVISGIREVLRVAGADHLVDVHDFGVWRQANWHDNGRLEAFQSVDWYIRMGRVASRNNYQVNTQEIFQQMWNEPWQESSPHYEVFVLMDDIYDGSDVNFVIGSALKEFGTVISIYRFRHIRDLKWQAACIQTETIHEVGHVFGLIPETRTKNVTQRLGMHCTNICTMRQGLSVPDDWFRITNDRIRTNESFCPACQRDLQNFFR